MFGTLLWASQWQKEDINDITKDKGDKETNTTQRDNTTGKTNDTRQKEHINDITKDLGNDKHMTRQGKRQREFNE